MIKSSVAVSSCIAILTLTTFSNNTNAASLTGLGFLPENDTSGAFAISADGSIVVGGSGNEAFKWTASTGMVGLSDLPGGIVQSAAHDISADGSTIVGYGHTNDGYQAFKYTPSTGLTGLGYPDGETYSIAKSVSADGSVIIGYCDKEALRWDASGWTKLGFLNGHDGSVAKDVSADGSTIVGYSYQSATSKETAFRWTASTGMVPLSTGFSRAYAISADSSTIVGNAENGAFKWTEATGMIDLGFLPGTSACYAYDTSADGSTIVGVSDDNAFVWNQNNGMQNLTDVLTDQNVDLTGWEILYAWGVSADGSTIVGGGKYNGNYEAFVAVIPEPTSLALLSLSTLPLLTRRR